MVDPLSLWAFSGTLALIILCYQDFKNKMVVDDRRNFFMFGCSLMIIAFYSRSVFYILGLIIVTIILSIFLNKFNIVGGADVSSLAWMFYGFGLIGVGVVLFFFVSFAVLTIVYNVIKAFIGRVDKFPFYPVLLSSFFFTCFVTGIYV